jgi:uncharacterized membrane protein (UPF0127 family)
MDKFANPDEKQLALRQSKAAFNKRVSAFITKLIAFKQSFNGRGNSKFSLPVGSIKDPIDKSIASMLSTLAGEFSSIADAGAKIISEQANYSATRRKKQAFVNGYHKRVPLDTYKRGSVKIGEHILPTYIAESFEEQLDGLMHITSAENMVFPYKHTFERAFWMLKTPSPLDIIFCHAGKIVSIRKGEPNSTERIVCDASDLVVELPYGTCKSLNITPGMSVQMIDDVSSVMEKLAAKYGC